MKNAIAAARLGLSLAAVATPAAAQTIYPLDRAQILVGADFDLKVEFPSAPASADVNVTIGG
jgi:alkaline phosphatase